MVFVDGSNFIGQLAQEKNLSCRSDKPQKDCFELARLMILRIAHLGPQPMDTIRSYWFGSYTGSEEDFTDYCACLRKGGFESVLFRRRKTREKGVDIALTKEMLVNSFQRNFDVGLLIAGDEDYVGLVREAKRYGGSIRGAFFETGLSKHLHLEFDFFYNNLSLYLREPDFSRILSGIQRKVQPAG